MHIIADALLEASQILRNGGVPEARREAASLLSFVVDKDRTFLLTHADYRIDAESLVQFQQIVERRASGEPLQYITGVQDFFGREFRVTPAVLIPRPETELLIEAALDYSEAEAAICDVGTGSGCIAVTLLCELKKATAVALDKSANALQIARLNSQTHGVEDRIMLVESDCFSALEPGQHQFDLVVSNPPYVSAAMLAGLQREVRDHEPLVALSPGTDGLSMIRRLILDTPAFLKENGRLLLEIGFDQGEAVRKLIAVEMWDLCDIRPDLQGIPRIVVLQKKQQNRAR
jgi:release factor glutamine methyltransferase